MGAMTDFRELRYPFQSLYGFLTGGYWLDVAALHLTLGLAFQLGLVAYVSTRRGSLVEKAVTCYLSLTLYNNFAYSVAGLRLAEVAGVVASLAVLLETSHKPIGRHTRVSGVLAIGGCVILLHALVIGAIYPLIDQEWSARALRFVLIGKIFTLALVGVAVERDISLVWIGRLARCTVAGGVVACALYLLQLGIYTAGITPFGTYWDAGFTGVPSFGSVSIERGHFGKFLVPLFPFFLLLAIERRRYWPLLLFLIVSAINFSASSLVFLLGYITISAMVFARRLFRGWGLLLTTSAVAIAVAVGVGFWRQYQGIVEKIILFAIDGGMGGGRGTGVLTAYLDAYPLGTSYGGSTLRTVGNLPEINMGVFAFVAQFTFLAVPLLVGFLTLNLAVLWRSHGRVDSTVWRALAVGVVMSWLIFLADVLWFVPTIWLPLLLLSRLSRVDSGTPVSRGAAASQAA